MAKHNEAERKCLTSDAALKVPTKIKSESVYYKKVLFSDFGVLYIFIFGIYLHFVVYVLMVFGWTMSEICESRLNKMLFIVKYQKYKQIHEF